MRRQSKGSAFMPTELFLLAQQTMPTFDGIYWLNLLSRILHILGAMILVGGLFYLWAVVMPSPAAANAVAAARAAASASRRSRAKNTCVKRQRAGCA